MAKSVHTDAYKIVIEVLVAARKQNGILQQELAKRIGKPQSFISKVETGERRIDVLEFYALARAIGADPADLYRRVVSMLPQKVDI